MQNTDQRGVQIRRQAERLSGAWAKSGQVIEKAPGGGRSALMFFTCKGVRFPPTLTLCNEISLAFIAEHS